jgi:hypothetical protein
MTTHDTVRDHIDAALAPHVERREVLGLAWLVAVGGVVHSGALGHLDAERHRPADDGTIALDAAVDRWLPELADRRVMARPDGPLDDTVAAARPITVDDVLSFRLGWGMDFAATGPQPVLEAMAGLQLGAGPPAPAVPPEPDEWIRRLGTLPLQYQPGERACSTRSGWPTPGSP